MGDYISRDMIYTLAKRINDKIINGEYHAATFGGVILDMIDELPPSDVVEVKRGRWEHTPTFWIYCSVCGREPNEYNERVNFCPYCGADMRGEGNETD